MKAMPGKRPPVYSTLHEFPHSRPYELYYAEKIPLLQAFEKAAAEWIKRPNTGYRRLIHHAGMSPPMRAAECGVFRGHSLVACLRLARDMKVPVHFVGLDSFEGLPPLSDNDLEIAPPNAPYRERVLFHETSLDEVQQRLKQAGFNRNASLVPGFFKDTLKTLPEARYDFVNIDCDLYDPHIECLEYFYQRMNKGGILFFDDYHSGEFPMAKLAVDKFMEGKPENLFHLRFGPELANHTKCYIEKA